MPTRMPPIITPIFGPTRSTNQPSTGTSQVSVSTKMLKATWIAARPQWYLASIGKTNSVQPYCRLAIITMQTMPKASCSQRNDEGRPAAARASVNMFSSFQALLAAMLFGRTPRHRWRMSVALHRVPSPYQRLTWFISSYFRIRANKSRNFRVTIEKARRFAVAVSWLVATCLAGPGLADDKPAAPSGDPPALVETQHSITLNGHPLEYRAIAETIGLTDGKGEPTASVFTIAYLAEPAAGERRPVAFVFNGGPGAASVFLHLGSLGPRILDTPATGAVPPPPVALVDNPSTWLAFTDLVFVDPVGTGFSRGKGKEDNPDKPFWNVQSDVNSLGAVVRRWLTRHQRWTSPVYLVGESYGGYRAAAMARSLPRDVGVTVSGLVLVSPAL